MVECTLCEREFETERGMRTHRGRMHRDWLKKKLTKLYVRENLSTGDIAERLDMHRSSVNDWVREFELDGKDPAKFHLEGHVLNGPHIGYPRWTHTGTGHRVRVHRLQAIASGADPHEVFGGGYTVDHMNGCPLDNREENLQLLSIEDHGQKDGKKGEVGHSHKEYLKALIQEPPEWAQKLRDSAEYASEE